MNHHENHYNQQRNYSGAVGGHGAEEQPPSMMNPHHYQQGAGGGGGYHSEGGRPLSSSNPPPHSHHHGHQQQLGYQQAGGSSHSSTAPGDGPPQKWHSFKMLIDPMIHHGAPKQVRYDGNVVPGNPHAIPPTPSDPRKKLPSALWRRLEAMEIPVPRFVVDENYVGEPPKVEVTIENLNDNVDKHFLGQMIAKFGVVEVMDIYYHPKTQKHLGLSRLVFEKVKSAKECVDHLHGRSVMGKQLNCYLDPFGSSCKKMFDDLTSERKLEPPKPPPPLPNDTNANNKDTLTASPSSKTTDQTTLDNNDIDSTSSAARISSSGSPIEGRYMRNEKGYRDRDYKDNRDSRRDSRDRDRHYNDYGRNSSRDSDYNSGSRSRRRGSDYNDRRGDSSWGSRDRYQRGGDDRRDSWRHDSRDRDHQQWERGSNNDREYWDHNSSRSNNVDHPSSSGRRDRSDSTEYNSSSGAYPMDPRHYDPSYSNDSSMYQPTMYDPQYNQADYWQLQAQQWKAKQAGANGDPSSTTIAPPLPIPPHLQNHHSMGSTPPPASSSKQLTPHHSDHHTPPSLSRTDSPLLDKDSKNNKSGDQKDGISSRDKSVEKEEPSAAKTLDHSVDLDTRLKMLMKDKSSAVPAFLLESLQSEEEEEEQVEQEVETVVNNGNQDSFNNHTPSPFPLEEFKPLSRAPSPFMSRDHYLNCHSEYVRLEREKHEKEMSDRSSQKRHQGSRNRGRRGGGRPDSRNSDAMSLSSLSSGENNILEEGPALDGHSHPYPQYYGYPHHPGGHHPSDVTGYYPTSGASGIPGSYPMYPGHPYDSSNVPPHLMGGGSQYHPGMPHGYYGSHDPAEWGYGQWGGNQIPGYPNDDPMLMYQGGKTDKKSIRPLIRATTERCEHDLKQTLSKDIKKRICETYAFYLYDKWWQEQEEKYKLKQSGSSSSRSKRKEDDIIKNSSNSKLASTGKTVDTSEKLENSNDAKVVKQMPRIPKTEDISNIFDKQRENIEQRGTAAGGAFGKGGSLGFGFRGTIPKLPSFKMKKVGQDRQKSLSEFSSDDDISDSRRHKSSSRYRHSSDRRREKEKRRERRIKDEERRRRNKELSDDQDENIINEKKRSNDKKETAFKNKASSPPPKEGDAGGVKKRTLSDMYKELYSDSGSDWKSDDDDLKKPATSVSEKNKGDKKKQNLKQGQKSKLSESPSRGWSDKDESLSRSSSPVSSSSSIASSDEEKVETTAKGRSKSKKRIHSGSSSRSVSKSSGHFSSSSVSSSENSTPVSSSSEDEKVDKTDKKTVKEKSKQGNLSSSKLETQKAKVLSKRKKKSGSLSSGSKASTSESSDASSEDESEASFKPSGSASSDSSMEDVTKEEDGEKDDVDIEGLEKDEEEKSMQLTPAKSKTMPQRRASATVKVRTPGVPPPTATPSNGEIASKLTTPPIYEESPPHITDHCYARPSSESLKRKHEEFENQFANEHDYTRPRTPPPPPSASNQKKTTHQAAPQTLLKSQQNKLQAATTPIARPKASVKTMYKAPTAAPAFKFSERSHEEEFAILYRFLTKGVNIEDIKYFKMAYQAMLEKIEYSRLVNRTHWVDHTITDLPDPVTPPKKKRRGAAGRGAGEDPQGEDFSKKHLTGSCRTEGYYKMDPREKARTKYHLQRAGAFDQAFNLRNMEGMVTKGPKTTSKGVSREQRSNQRRTKAILDNDIFAGSKLLEFNQLKFRRKNMTFGKSAIHDWGLFAMEYIGADEYVIEYVGVVIRPNLSDVREKRYEKQGIGSSYLFRIDQDYVVDATKCGNLARFINHSCDPNCYAKIITIDGEKKIVIYSKQPIAFGEEITYDYKFPIEDEKIRCLCATKNCRKYLN